MRKLNDGGERFFFKKTCRLSVLWWNSIKSIKISVFNRLMINFDDYVNENKTENNTEY